MAESFKETSAPSPHPHPHREPGRGDPNWPLRIGIAVLLIAGDALLLGNKEKLLSKLGFETAPTLPMPSAKLTTDEQALYWTYALYDMGKLRARFHMDGGYAISRGHARHELENLLPMVSPATMGEISGYGAVAFHAMSTAATGKPIITR